MYDLGRFGLPCQCGPSDLPHLHLSFRRLWPCPSRRTPDTRPYALSSPTPRRPVFAGDFRQPSPPTCPGGIAASSAAPPVSPSGVPPAPRSPSVEPVSPRRPAHLLRHAVCGAAEGPLRSARLHHHLLPGRVDTPLRQRAVATPAPRPAASRHVFTLGARVYPDSLLPRPTTFSHPTPGSSTPVRSITTQSTVHAPSLT